LNSKALPWNGVCPGFGDNRNDPVGFASILSLIIAGDDLEFLDGVGVGIIDNSIAEKVVVITAIKNESVGIVASARYAESGVGAGGASVLAASYVHMHLNRLFRSAQNAQEMELYDFLARTYDSKMAKEERSDR
jgi:hypothetical protein